MFSGFIPFCAFAGRGKPPISSNPTAIEASSTQRGERNNGDFCIMAFNLGILRESLER
jgi:hypothetical protein